MEWPAIGVEIKPIELCVLGDPPGDFGRSPAWALEIDRYPKRGTKRLAIAVELATRMLIAVARRIRVRIPANELVERRRSKRVGEKRRAAFYAVLWRRALIRMRSL